MILYNYETNIRYNTKDIDYKTKVNKLHLVAQNKKELNMFKKLGIEIGKRTSQCYSKVPENYIQVQYETLEKELIYLKEYGDNEYYLIKEDKRLI